MRLLRKGQSIIELAMVTVLIIAGIIVAGPYVLHSVNAHFKLWDDSVQDSLNDHLIQASKEQADINLPACDCTWVSNDCKAEGCESGERAYSKSCTPVGCDHGYKCAPDDSCCSPRPTNVCWRSAGDAPRPAANPPPGFHSCGGSFQDRVYRFPCGTNVGKQVCKIDTDPPGVDGNRDCTPVCNDPSNILEIGGLPCAHYNEGLTTDKNIHLVDACPADASNTCDAVCPSGTVPNATRTACTTCGNGIRDTGETCENCPADIGACQPADAWFSISCDKGDRCVCNPTIENGLKACKLCNYDSAIGYTLSRCGNDGCRQDIGSPYNYHTCHSGDQYAQTVRCSNPGTGPISPNCDMVNHAIYIVR